MRATALALAASLAAAGCSVSTSEYRPRTDEACAAQSAATKACGYRCVSVEDPSTGCGTPGDCQPCPAPAEANMVAACVSGVCGAACAAGYADCDASATNGCEVNLRGDDAARCGNCTHSCGSGSCAGGLCTAIVELSWIGAIPGAIVHDRAWGTVRYALTSPEGLTTTVGVASQVCRLGGGCSAVPGKVTALASAGETWWAGVVQDGSFALLEWPAVDPPVSTTVGTEAYFGDVIESMLVTSSARVVYTTFAKHQDPSGPSSSLHVFERGGTPVGVSVAGAGSPRSVGGVDPWYFAGTPQGGGTLYRWEDAPGAISQATSVAGTLAAAPTRIAGWSDASGNDLLFWASQDDGSVWRAPLAADGTVGAAERIYGPAGPTSHMAITSDPDGVYWCNGGTGRLSRWRASDGAVYDLSYTSAPHQLATDSGGRIYWTDPVDLKLYRTYK